MLRRGEFDLAYFQGNSNNGLTENNYLPGPQQYSVRCNFLFGLGQKDISVPLPGVLPIKRARVVLSDVNNCGFDLSIKILNRQGLEVFPALPSRCDGGIVGFESLYIRWKDDLLEVRHRGSGGILMVRRERIISAVCAVTESPNFIFSPIEMRVWPLNVAPGDDGFILRAAN